ncbi:hypothetical protein J4401_06710 [Candidatus Woesearchaeota archaeon]|nr:hypothetical protein [Candidatus Woesearchaeota archaeon]
MAKHTKSILFAIILLFSLFVFAENNVLQDGSTESGNDQTVPDVLQDQSVNNIVADDKSQDDDTGDSDIAADENNPDADDQDATDDSEEEMTIGKASVADETGSSRRTDELGRQAAALTDEDETAILTTKGTFSEDEITIEGSAFGKGFRFYEMDYALLGASNFQTTRMILADGGGTAVNSSTLAIFNTKNIELGVYLIRIHVYFTSGIVENTTTVQVIGADSFEPDNSFSQAKPLALNSKQLRSIYPEADNDFVSFDATRNFVYLLNASGKQDDFSPLLKIYDNAQSLIINIPSSLAYWYPPASASYFAAVSGNIGVYDFVLSATPLADDPFENDDNIQQARSLAKDVKEKHNFYPEGDIDYFTFSKVAGEFAILDIENRTIPTHAKVELLNANGNVIRTGTNSIFAWTDFAAGSHTIRLSNGLTSFPIGEYTINYSTTAPSNVDGFEPDNDYTQAREIQTDGTSKSHTFSVSGDADYVTFTAHAGNFYRISVESQNAIRISVYGTDGVSPISSSIDSDIIYSPTQSGRAYVSVEDATQDYSNSGFTIMITSGESHIDYAAENLAVQFGRAIINAQSFPVFNITNNGTAFALSQKATARLYKKVAGQYVAVEEKSVRLLQPSESELVQFTWIPDQLGQTELKAEIIAPGDENTGNDFVTFIVNVVSTGPDLSIKTLTANELFIVNESNNITIDIENQGDNEAKNFQLVLATIASPVHASADIGVPKEIVFEEQTYLVKSGISVGKIQLNFTIDGTAYSLLLYNREIGNIDGYSIYASSDGQKVNITIGRNFSMYEEIFSLDSLANITKIIAVTPNEQIPYEIIANLNSADDVLLENNALAISRNGVVRGPNLRVKIVKIERKDSTIPFTPLLSTNNNAFVNDILLVTYNIENTGISDSESITITSTLGQDSRMAILFWGRPEGIVYEGTSYTFSLRDTADGPMLQVSYSGRTEEFPAKAKTRPILQNGNMVRIDTVTDFITIVSLSQAIIETSSIGPIGSGKNITSNFFSFPKKVGDSIMSINLDTAGEVDLTNNREDYYFGVRTKGADVEILDLSTPSRLFVGENNAITLRARNMGNIDFVSVFTRFTLLRKLQEFTIAKDGNFLETRDGTEYRMTSRSLGDSVNIRISINGTENEYIAADKSIFGLGNGQEAILIFGTNSIQVIMGESTTYSHNLNQLPIGEISTISASVSPPRKGTYILHVSSVPSIIDIEPKTNTLIKEIIASDSGPNLEAKLEIFKSDKKILALGRSTSSITTDQEYNFQASISNLGSKEAQNTAADIAIVYDAEATFARHSLPNDFTYQSVTYKINPSQKNAEETILDVTYGNQHEILELFVSESAKLANGVIITLDWTFAGFSALTFGTGTILHSDLQPIAINEAIKASIIWTPSRTGPVNTKLFISSTNETDPSNNADQKQFTVGGFGIDISLDSMTFERTYVVDITDNFTVSFVNIGSLNVTNAKLDIFINGNLHSTSQIASLLVDERRTIKVGWQPAQPGIYTIRAIITAANEATPLNNERQSSVSARNDGPDVTPTIFSPGGSTTGFSTRFQYLVNNDGTKKADDVTATLIADGQTISVQQLGSIKEGDSLLRDVFWVPQVAGTSKVKILVSATGDANTNNDAHEIEIPVFRKVPVLSRLQPSKSVLANPITLSVLTDDLTNCTYSFSDAGILKRSGSFGVNQSRNHTETLSRVQFGTHDLVMECKNTYGGSNNILLSVTIEHDDDEDSYPQSVDCNDNNPSIHPDADEIPQNGIDEDCNSKDEDYVEGSVSVSGFVKPLGVLINGSIDLSKAFAEVYPVEIFSGTDPIVQFNHNFSRSFLNLGFTVEVTTSGKRGAILIKGLNLQSGRTKTAYVPQLNNTLNTVCVVDSEINSLAEVSSNCNRTVELSLRCDGTAITSNSNTYKCTDIGTYYKIEGLSNSAAVEYAFTTEPAQPPSPGSGSSSSGGGVAGSPRGGGGAGGGSSAKKPIEKKEPEQPKKEPIVQPQKPAGMSDEEMSGILWNNTYGKSGITGMAVSDVGKPNLFIGIAVILTVVAMGIGINLLLKPVKKKPRKG